MEKQFISEIEFKNLLKKIRYGVKNIDEAIEIYDYLKDKKTEDSFFDRETRTIENPHFEFLRTIFNRTESDYAGGFTEEDEEFLKSDYLSEELKKEINNKLKNNSKELTELLNSEKQINDFSKEEINKIMKLLITISNPLPDKERYDYGALCYTLETYLFVLDGKGPIEYIKEEYGKELPKAILDKSNLSSRASYYSGYGVDTTLLGERHLFSIYKKFVKYYPDKTEEFVKLVDSIPKLTPTEFINNYFLFVENGFNSDFQNKEGNISVDGLHGQARDLVGAVSIFSLFNKEQSDLDRYFESRAEASIRKEFKEKIEQFKNNQEQTKVKVLNKSIKH